ncbi:MAG: CoA transferase [Gammaproteobacteria bacterium]|nr:CoA transferase [Gammaproteobacteria bacterium]
MSGALDGVKVVDLTTVLMGPFATQQLGDMGADVIKVEPPSGDTSRNVGATRHRGMASGFLHCNRNKRAIVLDLKQAAGRDALLRLVAQADVLVYNVRPQAMARLRLTYADVAAVNSRIIYVGMFGYGQRGPYAAKPAYDDLIQGAVGIPSLVARVGDGVPRYVPVTMIDRTVGTAAVGQIAAALYRREKTGIGQSIEVPMFETMVPFVLGEHMAGQSYEPPLGPMGYSRLLARERTPFPTQDGYVCALIYTDSHWRSFFKELGQPERFDNDPRMADIGTRTAHIGDLYGMVADIMRTRSTAQWLAFFDKADIPAMRLNDLDSLYHDPHLEAVGYYETLEHPSEGLVHQLGHASTWSESPPSTRRLAPRLGEHSVEVLKEAGYGDDEIAAMLANGVTATV